MAYGFDSLPKQATFFIKNATIWTNEAEGILKNANLLIQNGKIKAVNQAIIQIPNDAVVIDAQGKHVTCGIIDEHSHIAISKGVNEGGQSVSAEVSTARKSRPRTAIHSRPMSPRRITLFSPGPPPARAARRSG